LQYKILATSSSYYINSEYFRTCKRVEKLALLITSEDKSNMQQNQASHSFSLITKTFHISDLSQSTDLRW